MSETTQDARLLSDHDARLWATLIHLGGIFFHFLPALIGYTVLAERGPFIRQQTRSALNFQLTILAGYVIGFVSAWVVIGFFVLLAVVVANVIFSILAAIEANRGEPWTCPIAIPFITA